MSIYLKSAVQNLDAHITELQEIRNRLAAQIPVQTLGPVAVAAAPSKITLGPVPPKEKRGGQPQKPKPQVPKSKGDAAAAALTAASAKMIQIGRALKEPFGTGEIIEATGGMLQNKQAGNVVTQWLGKGWIRRVEPGQYNRTKTFGGGAAATNQGERMLADIHREIEAASPKED